MEPNQFLIPKQTDESLVTALGAIRDEFLPGRVFFLRVNPHLNATHVDITDKEPAKSAAISYVINEHSEVMPTFALIDQANSHSPLSIRRLPGSITDQVDMNWGWASQIPDQMERSKSFVKIMALARKHLRAIDMEAGLSGGSDSSWTRYRDSQQAILNSLQETQKSVFIEFSKRSLEAEAAAKAKHEILEEELREKYKSLEGRLANEHGQKLKSLEDRESILKSREESFETKEARYVTRKVQQEQMAQIKQWLEGWSLTEGTKEKRWAVFITYILGLVATIAFTIWFTAQNTEILKAHDLAQITWWQWVLLSIRSIIPFAAFSALLIYFIKWSSAWARHHAEEEFRNRARVLDIGRSAWLLEAVRDAQDNDKELPPELLKELSRNLFSPSVQSDGGDIQPQGILDIFLNGLNSVRVKSPDGSEFEASKGKKK